MSEARLLTVNIGMIEEGERFRKEYGDLKALADSIEARGLIQPLAVEEQEGEKPYLLLAGGRRLRAMQERNLSDVLIRVFPKGMSTLERRSVELAENFYRKDLEWTEYVLLQEEIHNLQLAIHGQKISTLPDAPGWTFQKTADLLGKSKAGVVQDVKLGTLVRQHPEIFTTCKNKFEATKLLEKLEGEIIKTELAKRFSGTSKSTMVTKLADTFVIGDAIEGMKKLPVGSIDLVEIDPPYGIELQSVKSEAIGLESYTEVAKSEYIDFVRALLHESFRVMKQDSWLIFWYAQEPWQEVVYSEILSAGFTCSRMFGAWIKPTGQTLSPTYNLANAIECFYYARKGSPIIAKPGRINAFNFKPVPATSKVHPTERPIELMREILMTFGVAGMRLLVPCCGSGNTLIAGHELGMQPLGFELNKLYKDSFIIKVFKGGDFNGEIGKEEQEQEQE